MIVTSLEDALAAQRGGAGRLEVVSAMDQDGLTPSADLVRQLLDRVSIPCRVMLRAATAHTITPAALDSLLRTADALRAAGATEFAFGFLTPQGSLDVSALLALHAAAQPAAWTLHRAFDRTSNPQAAFERATHLPALDRILSSGHPDGLDAGLTTLAVRASWQTARVRFIAGGGLRPEHVPLLLAAGIAEFHAGRAVRRRHTWDAPVDEALVRALVDAVVASPPHT